MFELNIQFIITYIVVAGGAFFVTASAASAYYCVDSGKFRCPSGDWFEYPFYGGSGYSSNSSDICGYPELKIICNSNNGRPMVNFSNHLYYVLSVHTNTASPYSVYPIHRSSTLVDVEVDEEECPRPTHNITLPALLVLSHTYNVIYFYNCSSSSSGYPENAVQRLPCLDTNNTTTPGLRSFALLEDDYPQPDGFNWWYQNCQENVVVSVDTGNSYSDYRQTLKLGFTVQWDTPDDCLDCEDSVIQDGLCLYNQTDGAPPLCYCSSDNKLYHGRCPSRSPSLSLSPSPSLSLSLSPSPSLSPKGFRLSIGLKVIIGVCTGIGGLLLLILFIYRRGCCSTIYLWKSKVKTPTNVEVFLESVGCFGLLTYKYSEIKKIANSFKETLGQGGFGSVYKGRLQDGRLVAVKVLNELKGNGEDFINEIATIGRTNHINVVSLLGFCSSGTKRALVYEFMPNGSLENFIYDQENASITKPHLGWEKLYEIALGIAKGLEYLHHGCNTRILHFDIKPHNILLDQDFCPKITDFGLAKLCPTRESVISMTGGRGTTGYIAPEVGNRIFGGVSHKSDVYSYGMMVLEMIGGRKNMDLKRENTSEIYFPLWIYNHFQQDMNMDDCEDIYKEETSKKMITVALWCIQTQPTDRPSISKVVEMLEGNIEELQMPPNPFKNLPSRSSP